LGVEIYSGFAASDVLFNEDKTAVRGIVTRDMGIGKVKKIESQIVFLLSRPFVQ
jgi:hypothetical protein